MSPGVVPFEAFVQSSQNDDLCIFNDVVFLVVFFFISKRATLVVTAPLVLLANG